jgi:hypothetical protein
MSSSVLAPQHHKMYKQCNLTEFEIRVMTQPQQPHSRSSKVSDAPWYVPQTEKSPTFYTNH